MNCCSVMGLKIGIYVVQELGAQAAQIEAAAAKMAGKLTEYKAESCELHDNS